jgi:hypothetical protein
MGTIAVEIGLGIAFTIISLAPSIPEWIKKNDEPKLRVQVRTGLPQTTNMNEQEREEEYGKVNMGGHVPNVVLFNAAGDRIAHYRNKNEENMGHNAPHDIYAEYFDKKNTQTPEYITVTASGPDAICITSITVTPPNTQEMWAIVPGEVASECNKLGKSWKWAYSDTSVQITRSDGKSKIDVRPKCLWIDRTGNRGGTVQENNVGSEGFQVHLPDFKLDNSKWKEWEGDLSQMCDSVSRFAVFEKLNNLQCPQKFDPPPPQAGQTLPYPEAAACHPDIYHSEPKDDPALDDRGVAEVECMILGDNRCFLSRHRRSMINSEPARIFRNKAGNPFSGTLIWSQDMRVSAIELCQDPASRQADLYSEREQMFCDMETHTLYPVCGGGVEACFDPMQNVTRAAGNEKRELKPRYTKIHHWAKL